MYLILSFCISLVIYLIMQNNEYKKNPTEYNISNMYSSSNLGTFALLFIIISIIMYLFNSSFKDDKVKSSGGNVELSEITIDPLILKKIPDNIKTGFYPYND